MSLDRRHLDYLRKLVRREIAKHEKRVEKYRAEGRRPLLKSEESRQTFRQNVLAEIDAAFYASTEGEVDLTAEWHDAVVGAARAFVEHRQPSMTEDEYADLLDDVTAEFAAGVKIRPEDSPAFERFALAVDAELKRLGEPHPYETEEVQP